MKLPWWIVVGALALAVRLLFQSQISDYVLFRVPLIDAEEYVGWAVGLAAGRGEPADVYYKAPFYPWVLSAWVQVFGYGARAIAAFNTLLGIANVLLLGIWCRRVLGARWGNAGAVVAAVFAPMLLFEVQALPATLSLTLATASLLCLDRLIERPQARWLVATALCLGCGMLTRPTLALWVPVAAALVWLQSAGPVRGRLLRGLALVLLAFLVVLPVTARNRSVGDAWVLVSANGGINFYLGNNADAAHTMRMRSGIEWEVLVSSLPEAERQGQARWDRWFGRQALQWAREHPLDFVRGLGDKSLEYLNAHRIDRNLDSRGFESRFGALRLLPGFAWLAPWWLLGGVVAWRRRGAARRSLALAATLFAATVLVFVAERYKLDALPGLLVLALLGVREVVAQVRRQETVLPLAAAGVLLLLGSVLAFGNWNDIRSLQPAHAATLEGVGYYKERNWPVALERLQRAVQDQPDDADAQMTLGTTWQQLGRLREAYAAYARAQKLVPGHARPWLNMGWIERDQGDLERAQASFENAVRIDPRNARAHYELATVFEMRGETVQALQHYMAAERHADDPQTAQAARQRVDALRR